MLNYTDNILTAPVRDIYAEVLHYSGGTLVDTYKRTGSLIDFSIERVGNESKFFGYGVCQKFNIHIRDKDGVLTNFDVDDVFQINFSTANSVYNWLFPSYFIKRTNRDENTGELSITAYDNLYNLSKYTFADIAKKLTAPYTIKDVVVAIADKIWAEVEESDWPEWELEYTQGANYEGTENLRDVLDDIAEATQSVYFLKSCPTGGSFVSQPWYNSTLVFKRFDKDGAAALTIGKSDYFTLESGDNRRLCEVVHATELGDNVSADTGKTGTTVYIRDNPFWNNRSDVGTLVENAIAVVGGLTINQFECSWRGNLFLEILDKIALVTKTDGLVYSYVLDDVLTYDGTLSQETRWHYTSSDAEDESNPSTLGEALKQTFAKVDKVNREIELVAKNTEGLPEEIAQLKITTAEIEARVEHLDFTEMEELRNDVASLKISSDSITEEVTKVEETLDEVTGEIKTLTQKVEQTVTPENVQIIIKEQLAGGVDAVTTTTGYTFNTDGLTISKSGSEMSTQITEDGMTIHRDDTQVLTVNHIGVEATNLHATTYLIIGGLNRFEEYIDAQGDRRIGAFWLLE